MTGRIIRTLILDKKMRLTNVNGTSENNCRCGSWLDHWKKYNSGRQTVPTHCPVNGCYNEVEVGAHVQKDSYSDKNWYIVPLCNAHNKQTRGSLDVSDTVALASANVSLTCGR